MSSNTTGGCNDASAPHTNGNGVEHMLDHWVDQFERIAVPSIDVANASPRARDDARPDARPAREGRPKPTQTRRQELPPVVLTRSGSSLQHLGTVTFRGPCSITREAISAAGPGDVGAIALEFVGAWFGVPFDAVNLRLRKGHPLAWGFWHLAGDALTAAMALWKARAREDFDSLLAAHGVDVVTAAEPSAATSDSLVYRDPRQDRTFVGEVAESLAARDPVVIAALAAGGRMRTAQLAQVETVFRRWLEPASTIQLPGTGQRIGQVLTGARGLATLYYTTFSLGRRGVEQLATSLDTTRGVDDDLARDIATFADQLRVNGFATDAHNVLRILSSPELDSDTGSSKEGGNG